MARGIVATTQLLMRAAEYGLWRQVALLRMVRRDLLERLSNTGETPPGPESWSLRALRDAVDESEVGLLRIEARMQRSGSVRDLRVRLRP